MLRCLHKHIKTLLTGTTTTSATPPPSFPLSKLKPHTASTHPPPSHRKAGEHFPWLELTGTKCEPCLLRSPQGRCAPLWTSAPPTPNANGETHTHTAQISVSRGRARRGKWRFESFKSAKGSKGTIYLGKSGLWLILLCFSFCGQQHEHSLQMKNNRQKRK